MTIMGFKNLKDTFCKEQWLNAPYFHGSQNKRMRLQMATDVIKVRCLNWIASYRGTKPLSKHYTKKCWWISLPCKSPFWESFTACHHHACQRQHTDLGDLWGLSQSTKLWEHRFLTWSPILQSTGECWALTMSPRLKVLQTGRHCPYHDGHMEAGLKSN